jgi:hypothetical protein
MLNNCTLDLVCEHFYINITGFELTIYGIGPEIAYDCKSIEFSISKYNCYKFMADVRILLVKKKTNGKLNTFAVMCNLQTDPVNTELKSRYINVEVFTDQGLKCSSCLTCKVWIELSQANVTQNLFL